MSNELQASQQCCVRIRIEGKSPEHIKAAAKAMGVVVVRVFEKSSKASGYGYYAYGNSLAKYEY